MGRATFPLFSRMRDAGAPRLPREAALLAEGESVARMPAEVTEAACFDALDPGTVIDLTGTRFLATRTLTGLLRLARRSGLAKHEADRPVRLRIALDSQPYGI